MKGQLQEAVATLGVFDGERFEVRLRAPALFASNWAWRCRRESGNATDRHCIIVFGSSDFFWGDCLLFVTACHAHNSGAYAGPDPRDGVTHRKDIIQL